MDTYLRLALDIGEDMLCCGAETNRVEDSIQRICQAFGAQRVDVLTITSSIVVTVYETDAPTVTQTRRILKTQTDLGRLERLNQLSRDICAHQLSYENIKERLNEIEASGQTNKHALLAAYVLIAGSFSMFFGGSVWDVLASSLIAVVLMEVNQAVSKAVKNRFLVVFCSAFLGGMLANLAVAVGFGESVDKISIGNIMLFIPGLAITNAIRDIFSEDTIAGLLRFVESCLLAMVIAFGFVLASAIASGGI